MGYCTTTTASLLIISLLSTHTSAQVTFTIESVVAPGGTPYTPPVAANKQYDIPAGSNVSLKCEIAGAYATIRFQTLDIAKYNRFNGSRIGPRGNRLWALDQVQYYDTGSVECYNPSGDGSDSFYLFINDEDALYLPWNSPTVTANLRTDFIPCLPTNSVTELRVVNLYDTTQDGQIDKQQGIKFSSKPRSYPLKCIYTLGIKVQEQQFSVVDNGNDPVYPSPAVSPRNYTDLYLAGDQLIIDCSVSYESIQSMRWEYPAQLCDSNPSDDCVGSDSRVVIADPLSKNGKVSSVLTISPAHASDTGDYSCSYLPNGRMDYEPPSSYAITVYPGPYVIGTVGQTSVKAQEGDEVMLSAMVEALPTPTVVWTFNSRVLTSGGKYTIVNRKAQYEDDTNHEVYLKINSLVLGDAGTYTMTASVDGDEFTADYQVEVHVPPTSRLTYIYKGEKMTLTQPTKTVYVRPNQDVDLECRAVAGSPKPTISWYWQQCDQQRECEPSESVSSWTFISLDFMTPDQSTLVNSPFYTMTTNDNQNISLTAETSGWLRCATVNSAGSHDSRIRLAVSELAESSKGVGFTERTLSRAADLVEDDSLLLQCYVARFECVDTDVQIVATVGGQNSVYTKNSQQINWDMDDNSYAISLRLANISISMSGDTYVCRCNNGPQGTPEAKLVVYAYVAASWVKSPAGSKNVSLGETHSFLCQPAGKPLPAVSWYKDGEPLVTSGTVLLSANSYTLTIVKAGKGDSGTYKCEGTSRRGMIESTFTLAVNEPVTRISSGQIALIVVIVIVVIAIAIVLTVYIVRKYCRKRAPPPHQLLLPSKEMINPDIPIDEQTDALPYDIGWEFPMASLKLGMLLGQGAFGRVLKAEAMNIEEGVASTTVAVKAVRDHSDIEQVKSLISELKILIHIGQHLNIVNLLGACTKDISKGQILVIVEFCRYGNLRSYLLKHKSNFNPSMDVDDVDNNTAGVKLGHVSVNIDEDYLNEGPSELHSQDKPVSMRDIMSWCYQIARGMEYLASIDYIHRDLAARNVLLADDNIVKICDFGLAKDIYKYQEYQKQTDGPLPIKWMALESLTHKVFNVRTDVWAYGVTVWELFSLAATPYPGWEIDDTFIDKLQDGYRMEIPKHCTQQVYEDVMLSCWHPDPEKRPNFAELAEMMGESVDAALKERLTVMEDPYLRSRDSRTDIKIRPSSVRRRDPHDLDSAYLATKSLQKSNGSAPNKQYHNYYNTSPTGSQPSAASSKKPWKKEKATNEEKLPLHVQISDDDDDDMAMPAMPAPSPSPWERQSHLGKLAVNISGDDSHSRHSLDSEGSTARPPSYNYVMKKSDPKARSTDVLVSPASSSASPARRSVGHTGSGDTLDHPKAGKSYIETTC